MFIIRHIIDFPGVENMGIVVPGAIYRGAQPTSYDELKERLFVRTIINLREFHDDDTDIKVAKFPMTVFTPASHETLHKIIAVMQDRVNWPVFVHCAQGADRTGYVCAAYRVMVQRWSVEQAIEEMESYILSPIGELWFPIRQAVKELKQ